MRAEGFSLPSVGASPAARSLALGLVFGVLAALFAGAGLTFCGVAAYLSLTPYLTPPLAALAVGLGGLVVALIVAWIGRACVTASADHIAGWVKSSELIAMTPQLLSFAVRHARLLGIVSAAGAAYLAIRSKPAH